VIGIVDLVIGFKSLHPRQNAAAGL